MKFESFLLHPNIMAGVVRSIERALCAKIEHRTLKGVDYTKPPRDVEFTHPQRKHQRRRDQAGAKQSGVRTSATH